MQIKTIAMMVAVGCAATILTGCGVPQEEYDAKVAALDTAMKDIEGLKGKKADLESLLNSEKSKVRNTRIELDNATKRIATLKKAEAAAASALADEKSKVVSLEGKVSSAQAALASAQTLTADAESALVALQAEYEKLLKRFESMQKNMNALSAPPKKAAPARVSAPAPAPTAEKSALDVLNDMGNM